LLSLHMLWGLPK